MTRTLLLICLSVFLFSCKSEKKFEITGRFHGMEEGKLLLKTLEKGQLVGVDTTDIVNGEFQFSGDIEMPQLFYILIDDKKPLPPFFVEQGSMVVEAFADSLDKTVFTGSKTHDEFKLFMDQYTRFAGEVQQQQSKYRMAHAGGNEEKVIEAKAEFEAAVDNQRVFARNFVSNYKHSVVAPFVVRWQLAEKMTVPELDEVMEVMEAEVKKLIYYKELKAFNEERKKVIIGAVAPDFAFNDTGGNPIALSSLRGKILLVDFWASWCRPCRIENPDIVKIYHQYKDKGFDILGVSLDYKKEEWLDAIEKDGLTWHHVSDLKGKRSEAVRLFRINAIPYNLLLDAEGRIIARNLHGVALENKLKELLD